MKVPSKLRPVFTAQGVRYRGAYGGRGSGKSATFAQMALLRGMERPTRILCGREIQNSIRESVHAELCHWVEALGLGWFYECGDTYIRSPINGTEILYRGFLRNLNSIKSMSNIGLVLIEEAESVSQQTWDKLIPTIRAPGSEIWAVWNPEHEDSPVSRIFDPSDPRVAVAEINWRDNPWFPPELEAERLVDERRDPDRYAHIWEGQPIRRSDAQILAGKWRVEAFEPGDRADGWKWEGPMFGADWGFSQDPTALVQVWIRTKGKTRELCISHEFGQVGLELRHTAEEFRKMPGLTDRSEITADCSRPETISHVRGDGLNVKPCVKWQGSVEDGITHLRGAYDAIVIHPRCVQTRKECLLYRYKVDPLTDEVTGTVIDKNNHFTDAIRYALGRRIRRRGAGFFG